MHVWSLEETLFSKIKVLSIAIRLGWEVQNEPRFRGHADLVVTV
jgi:hypothetical protein